MSFDARLAEAERTKAVMALNDEWRQQILDLSQRFAAVERDCQGYRLESIQLREELTTIKIDLNLCVPTEPGDVRDAVFAELCKAAAVEAERDALRRDIDLRIENTHAILDHKDRVHAALARYGRHDETCARRHCRTCGESPCVLNEHEPCDCGFDAAREGR